MILKGYKDSKTVLTVSGRLVEVELQKKLPTFRSKNEYDNVYEISLLSTRNNSRTELKFFRVRMLKTENSPSNLNVSITEF